MLPGRPRLHWTAFTIVMLLVVTACFGGGDGTEAPAKPDAPTSTSAGQGTPATEPEAGFVPMRIRPAFFGMHDGRVAQGLTPTAPVGSLRLWDTGTSWLHLELSPGRFTWDPLDTAVAAAKKVGARPLLVLGQTPNFYASKPRQDAAYGPGAASMPDLGAWRRYVKAVAKRYGDQIDYQIWNEANIVGYWAGTPSQMARLTIEASRAIRQVVPDATLVAPAFALRLPEQKRYFQQFWALQSPQTDLEDAVDVVSVQLYPLADGLPEAEVGLLTGARRVLAQSGIDRPVWNTEINFGLRGGLKPTLIPAKRQRAFLMRAYLLNAGLGVRRVYWYRWEIGPISNTYLTESDGVTETLAGRSFDVLRDWLGGTLMDGCALKKDEPGVWECTAHKGDQTRTFWWKPKGGATSMTAMSARRWGDADGTVKRCSERCQVPVGRTPVMVVSNG